MADAPLCDVHNGWPHRRRRISTDHLEREQASLAEVARALGAAITLREVADRVVESAVELTRAFGAYVERFDTPQPGSEVEVVAVTGRGVPVLGTRLPYPGSLSQELMDSGAPEIITEIGAIGERMAPYLHETCAGCTGLVVPLSSGGVVLGALVLLRDPGQTAFTDEEAAFVRILGDAASAALRRVLLVEEIDRERRARTALLESTGQGMYGVDTSGAFTFVNRAGAAMLGYEPQDLIGRTGHDLIHHSHADGSPYPEEDCPILTTFRTGVGVHIDTEVFWRSDGAWFPVEYSSYPIVVDGRVEGSVVTFNDITERKAADEALRESEERFRAFAENATVAIIVIDEASTIQFANKAVERIFGYPPEEVTGRSINDLMPEDQRRRHDDGVRRYLDTGRRNISWEGAELPGLTRDGRVIPLEISFGEFERDGRRYFTGIVRDITERTAAEAALRESEERFRMLGNSVPQLVWIADAAGHTFWFNDRWYDYTGRTPGEDTGRGWQSLVHPDHLDQVAESMRRSFATTEPWEATYPLRRADGVYRWFLTRALPIRGADGAVVRWVGSNTDVTDRMDAAEERERLLEREREGRAQLQRVMESRARLMRGFSHDVKNPLGSADGFLALLEEGITGDLDEAQLDHVRRARRAIGSSLRLIEDLLQLARTEAGDIRTERVSVDVGDVVRELGVDYRAQADAHGLVLEIDAPDDLPSISTDPARVRQILGNLFSNAIKYTDHGTVRVTVETHTNTEQRRGDWLAVDVCDTGPGIPPELRSRLFHEFSRVDSAGKKGSGVGLAISQRLAHALGGEITLESEEGKGSTFTLWLPCGTNASGPAEAT